MCNTFAQNKILKGRVVDEQQNALPAASIKIQETNQYTAADNQGNFRIPFFQDQGVITLEISFIGKQKITKQIHLKDNEGNIGTIVLKNLDLSLEEIQITADRNYEGSSNSSLLINRDIIEQTPALSLNDLLNQIPNRKYMPPSLQAVQNLTLRSTFAETTTGRGVQELNNAFGVAIILDGNAISNNMNMQSYNPGTRGVGLSGVTSGNGYGVTNSSSYSGDYAFGGTDLRQIPVENIESIEVVAGVPSAKYGDLSEGAVIIERQAGYSPFYFRTQLRDNANSYSLTKGFKLSDKLGALNTSFNYTSSFQDNRDKLKEYKRINASTMWTNTFGHNNQLKNTLSIDYGKNLDGFKDDPDDITKTKVRFDSWNFSVSNRSSYRVDSRFLKNVGLNLRYSEGHQFTYKEQLVNKAYTIYTDAIETGITEGTYAPGIFTAVTAIDGRPVNASAKLDFTGEFLALNTNHYLSFGISYNYEKNKGLGQQADPSRPRPSMEINATSLSAGSAERYYDYTRIVPQKDAGAYIEDVFKVKLAGRDLNVRSGVRFDWQNSLPSFSPRTNLNYQLNKKIRFGLAYGLSFKSPGLAQRYPGPTFYEIPLLNAYNGNVNESAYLVYVHRYDPSSKDLKSIQSQTFEFTSHVKLKGFNLSLAVFDKRLRNGISTKGVREIRELPTYQATIRPGNEPLIEETGKKKYMLTYQAFDNMLRSNSQGAEVILNTPRIKAIQTSFNLSGGFFRTAYKSSENSYVSISDVVNQNDDYAVLGVYQPNEYTAYLSNARLSTITHIPKVSLIIQFIADFAILQKSEQSAKQGIPIAYYTKDFRYIDITNFNSQDPNYSHLYKPASELDMNNQEKIIPNFHLSIAKEIKKRLKFSFNVYNVFNYQPSYTNSANEQIYPNSAPAFGAEISLKL